MGLGFILGRAGTGKTRACLDAIRAETAGSPQGPALIMLVPEQASHQTERALVTAPGGPRGTMRAYVLSFKRLAVRVLAEAGSSGMPVLDDLGRHMLLASLVAGRQRSEELQVFRGSAGRRGFPGRLARTLDELAMQRLDEAALLAQLDRMREAGEGDTVLAGKLHDLALLLRDYRERLADVYLDPQDPLNLAADRLANCELLRGARVWVDGFAGFTPQEYLLLGGVMGAAAEVRVALCLDPRLVQGIRRAPAAESLRGLFAPTLKTYHELLTVASQRRVRILEPLTLPVPSQPVRFRAGGVLTHLERHWERPEAFSPGGRSASIVHVPGVGGPAGTAADRIRLVAAADQRAEAEAAASEILRLCREEGYQWRDISVLVPEMESYHDLLRTVFAQHRIPCFIDRRRPAPYHPVVEFLRSAVEVVLTRWAPDAVFRWLKTDLGPLDRADVDLLENYVLAHGIRGSRWVDPDPWRFWPRAAGAAGEGDQRLLELIDAARRRVAAALDLFCQETQRALQARVPATLLVRLLWGLLASSGVDGTLQAWHSEANARGLRDQAEEHRQVWRRIVALLEQLYAGLGELGLRLDEFSAVLEAGLESLTLGLVPPSLDQVLCGTVERSRQPDIKAAFVLGACQGSLPGAPSEDLIFTDRERDRLAGHGLQLAPTARERTLHQEYLMYIALTRAADHLWISWPRTAGQGEGGARGPSPAVARLKVLFPDLVEQAAGVCPPSSPPAMPDSLPQAAEHVARALSLARAGYPIATEWRTLYDWLVSDPARRTAVRRPLSGLGWTNASAQLPGQVARKLFGSPVRGSATRLERFAGCPFAHFAADGLRLAPRPRQQVQAPELGSFFHAVLQAFYGELARAGLDFAHATQGQVEQLLDAVLGQMVPRLQSEVLLSSGRYRYLSRILSRTMRRTVRWLQAHARRSRFQTVAVEMGFGLPGSQQPALTLPGLEVRGMIDRIDLAQQDGRRLLRIVDYKSGSTSFRLADAVCGLSTQLLLYLAAAVEFVPGMFAEDGPPLEIAGAFLFPVRDPLVRLETGCSPEEAERRQIEARRPGGLVLDDPEVIRLMDAEVENEEETRLFSFRITRAGTVQANLALSAAQIRMLVSFARAQAAAFADRISAGEVEPRPWRSGTDTACAYCDFHALCLFDPQLPDNRYRELPGLDKAEVWRHIEAVAGGGGESS
ncbi:MAG: exodeoxyribonuclease V subunit gamma [Bacillota bacterium]|nr:exodeoxyribonuclease V subunit gamma [Bacillota bacterium]